MSNKSPIFPICEPRHFSDYGFDPQIDYFQVLEEGRKHKREPASRSHNIDLHFKLKKPISKDESFKKIKRSAKKRWWRDALLFFKFDKWAADPPESASRSDGATARIMSISGPVYITESTMSGRSSPYRTATLASSGEVEIPYVSLREINMDRQHRISTTAGMPIYLVT
ncbi:hypothetical protein F511_38408 [Dorcoceras hygrometricum]|uniref:Uncharacterized protein n=1 Tax=Dorcoceras hygrometricum TaxID=472368 RepID=A0A2Z7B295_9LAMI|nr:hypothetical protein F511_38408 [Dorcoceras hygrometricum]